MQIQSIYIWICNLSFNNICRNITPRKWNQAEVIPSTETVLEQTDLGREKTRNDPNNHQNKVCQLSGTEQRRSMGNWTGHQGCVYSAIDRPHWCVLSDRQEGKLVERSVINIIIRIKKTFIEGANRSRLDSHRARMERQTRRTNRRPTGDLRERTNGQKRMELLSVILLLVLNPAETQIQKQIHTHTHI